MGSGTRDGDAGSSATFGAVEVEASGVGADDCFLAAAAEALSKAALRSASGTEGSRLVESLSGVSAEGADAWGLLGVPAADDTFAPGCFAGVVVTEVELVSTGPMASLSSPNSFHSSTVSRSWRRGVVSLCVYTSPRRRRGTYCYNKAIFDEERQLLSLAAALKELFSRLIGGGIDIGKRDPSVLQYRFNP